MLKVALNLYIYASQMDSTVPTTGNDCDAKLVACNKYLNECKASLIERDEQITKLNNRVQSYKLRITILYAVMGVLIATILGLGVWILFLNKDEWFKNKKGDMVNETNDEYMDETVYDASTDYQV